MASEFAGKRVLVTGGARGLGEAIVRAFVKEGATVFALDKEAELLAKLNAALPQVTSVVVDLGDWEVTRKAVAELLPIHHLVNNAGVTVGRFLTEVDELTVDWIMTANFKQIVNVSQVVANGLIERKEPGTIVNITSIISSRPYAGGSIYSCSKAALSMLTKCQALEFGPHNIRVNAVKPTVMATSLVTNPEDSDRLLNFVLDKQIVKRVLETREAAELVLFLSSSKASMITGEEIAIDAGFQCN